LRHVARNLFLVASILLAGGISTIAHAQGQAPAAPQADDRQQSRAQQLMGDIAPKMAELTDNVLFGDIWERPQLSKRDRSLITVAALIAMNRPDQLRSHFALARQNGVTEDELIETITHLAFYAGWPSAVTAISVAKDVFSKALMPNGGGVVGPQRNYRCARPHHADGLHRREHDERLPDVVVKPGAADLHNKDVIGNARDVELPTEWAIRLSERSSG
jgi:4-carboxymuconolactone decarboxylase